MAEAFAATGAAGVEVLKTGAIQRLAGPRGLPVFRRFATKLGASNPEARSWLVKQASYYPEDTELRKVVETLEKQKTDEQDSPDTHLREYLRSGDRNALNALRFWKTAEVLNLLKANLSGSPSAEEIGSILQLLKGYETRHRAAVVEVVLTHWEKLSDHDYEAAVEVLTAYSVPQSQHNRAVDVLNRDLSGTHASAARRGLERLLG